VPVVSDDGLSTLKTGTLVSTISLVAFVSKLSLQRKTKEKLKNLSERIKV
jgi:hypothetical protein